MKDIRRILFGIVGIHAGLVGVVIGAMGQMPELLFGGLGLAALGLYVFLRQIFKK